MAAQPESAPAQPTPAPATAEPTPTAAPAASANAPEAAAAVAQPSPAAAESESAPAEPAAAPIRAANARESWEKPNRGTRRAAAIELFGGYEFARLDSGGGAMTNLNGALGSFGWNVRPWLQLVADSSYNLTTISGTKNVLYGNHWGPRLFHYGRYPLGAVPFVEALFGGSRADTTVSGVGGYTASANCFSFKVGGGLDIHPSRHLKIRLFDFDYYRTAFGANLHQNNYSASTGIVLRLFGGGSE
jgi:opacity protein-like surface antigen